MKRILSFKVQIFALFLLLMIISGLSATVQVNGQNSLKLATNNDFNKAADFFKTGIKFLREGKNSNAAGQFASAVKLQPDYAEAHNALGTAYFNLNRNREAITSFRYAIRLKPDYAAAFYN